jgi:hypothetical protein
MTTNPDLEQRFTENGIPRRHLYPVWYRINRAIGLRHRPPVLLNLLEHYLYIVPVLLAALGLGMLISQWLNDRPIASLRPLLAVFLLVPLVNWIRYRNIRRRIGLTRNDSAGD